MKIGIMVAMDKEYALVEALHSDDIILCRSGVGKVNAAAAATRMIMENRPDCIISTGCAGGLAPDVNVMDIVVGSQTCYHDVDCGEGFAPGQIMGMPERYDADASLYAKAMGLSAPAGSKIVGGLICTGDTFCTRKEQTDVIMERFPQAAAVDMESAAIAQVCHLYQVPFISFRIISDSANGDTSRLNEYNDFWGEVAGRSFGIFEQFIETL
jgi:adenosylhomocysteine nucleosidase